MTLTRDSLMYGLRLAIVVATLAAAACGGSGRRPSNAAPAPAGGPWPGYGQPPPPYGWAPSPGGASPGPAPPAPWGPPPAPPPAGFVQNDPINAVDIGWMRQRMAQVHGELVNALPPAQRQRIEGIPLFSDPTVGEVNAFAACDEQGVALMAVSDGLLDVTGHLAQFRATDEIFGTRQLDAYIQLVATQQKPGRPVVRPPPGFVNPAHHVDPRKVARQNVLFEEALAFVVGHEMAHHHLGHTGCARGGRTGVQPADIGRVLSRAAPVFNQPNEIGADVAGTNNLLTAGSRRQGARWNEGGAMLVLNFFAGLDRLTPADIVFGFERTHPPPTFRMPVVQQAAQTWRLTGGVPLLFPPF